MNCSCPINKYWSMQNQKMPCGAVPKCNYDLDDLFWSAYTTWWQPCILLFSRQCCWLKQQTWIFGKIRSPWLFHCNSSSPSIWLWEQIVFMKTIWNTILFKSAKTSFGIFLRLRRHNFFLDAVLYNSYWTFQKREAYAWWNFSSKHSKMY